MQRNNPKKSNMEPTLEQWQYPIGRYLAKETFSAEEIQTAIGVLKAFPTKLSAILSHCNEEDLNSPYRPGGWKISQLVHHIADSHMQSYIRCKFAYLEDRPTIMNYQEQDWAEKSPEALSNDIVGSLKIIEGVHQRWTDFFSLLQPEEFNKTYVHPERTAHFPLAEVVCFYAWHAQHHLAHIVNYKQHKV